MFPVPESIGEDNLVHHLQRVLSRWHPFLIHLNGFQKSWDLYLFLTVQEGNADMISLHREIYTDVLVEYRHDNPFIPHLTLGRFAENEHEFDEALEEARARFRLSLCPR